MLAKAVLGTLGTITLAGVYVVQEGAIRVRIDENRPEGTHLHLILPAAAVPVALRLVPDGKLRDAAEQACPWLPALRVGSEELARLPDSDLVEVRDERDHVRISTRAGGLVIDVESPDETVHLSFPLKTLTRVAERLEAVKPSS